MLKAEQSMDIEPTAAATSSRADLGKGITTDNVNELLETHKPELPLTIAFRCYDIPFTAVASESPEGPKLSVAGFVGQVPYTVESADARRTLKSVLADEPEFAAARLKISERHRIVVQGELPLDGDATPSRIVATATAFVATSKPLIDLVRGCLPQTGAAAADTG